MPLSARKQVAELLEESRPVGKRRQGITQGIRLKIGPAFLNLADFHQPHGNEMPETRLFLVNIAHQLRKPLRCRQLR